MELRQKSRTACLLILILILLAALPGCPLLKAKNPNNRNYQIPDSEDLGPPRVRIEDTLTLASQSQQIDGRCVMPEQLWKAPDNCAIATHKPHVYHRLVQLVR